VKEQSKKVVEKLIQQFPFLGQVIRRCYDKANRPGYPKPDIHIGVKRVDASLLYRQSDMVNGNCRLTSDVGEATQEEYPWIVFGSPHDCVRVFFPMTNGSDLLIHLKETLLAAGEEKVKTITHFVWVTEQKWFPRQESTGQNIAFPKAIYVYITVYRMPSCGLVELLRTADPAKNVELTGSNLVQGCIREDPGFIAASEKLVSLASNFEKDVWETGLSKIVDGSKKKGMSGNINGVEIMSWVMCGRVMITMELPDPKNPKIKDSFTIIGNEPPGIGNFSWKSIYATCDKATEIMEKVISGWKLIPAERQTEIYKDNMEVKLAGMP
jgi:hypothetical protein